MLTVKCGLSGASLETLDSEVHPCHLASVSTWIPGPDMTESRWRHPCAVLHGELWVAYGAGSGKTERLDAVTKPTIGFGDQTWTSFEITLPSQCSEVLVNHLKLIIFFWCVAQSWHLASAPRQRGAFYSFRGSVEAVARMHMP